MTIVFNPYSIPVIVTAFFCALLALFIKTRKNTRLSGHLLGLILLVILWCVGYAFELCFVNEQQKLTAIMVQYIAIPIVPSVFALFVYRYANPDKKTSPLCSLLFIIPVISTVLMFTNNAHHLMHVSWTIQNIPGTLYTFLVPQYGIGFAISTAYSYIVMLAMFLYILYVSVKTTRLFSSQAILLFCCALIPIMANLMYFINKYMYIYLDITPTALLISAGLMTYLITGLKLIDLQPVARNIIIENASDGTILLDSANRILDLNPMAEKIFSIRKTNFLGKNLKALLDVPPPLDLNFQQPYTAEFKRDDKIYHLSVLPLHSHTYTGQVLTIRDVTETKLAENKIKHLAFIDTLTGLPNHTKMLQELESLLEDSNEKNVHTVILLVDIKNITYINSSYGYEMGDALIFKVSKMIQPLIWNTDIFARTRGNEFFIAMQVSGAAKATAVSLTEKITRLFLQPIAIKDNSIYVTVNIGICISPADGKDTNVLIQKASLALQQSKTNKEHFAFYSAEKESEIAERNKLLHALHTALENGQFSLEYQPQYDSETDSLFGVEALLRWTHPELGKVPPSKFISLLEDSGMIIPVGNWVIKESAQQYKEWTVKGLSIPKFSINLSVIQFDDANLVPFILKTLDSQNIPRHCLEIEITETLAALAASDVVKKIRELSKAGARIAIDDFGSGFSSLTYFKYLCINTLKIDKEISADIHKNQYSRAILESLTHICDALNVDMVAEYVENTDQIDQLIRLGCKKFQGYYYAKPLSSAKLEQYAANLQKQSCIAAD